MPIRFQCPKCQKSYKVDDKHAGKKSKCQSCQTALVVPSPEEVAARSLEESPKVTTVTDKQSAKAPMVADSPAPSSPEKPLASPPTSSPAAVEKVNLGTIGGPVMLLRIGVLLLVISGLGFFAFAIMSGQLSSGNSQPKSSSTKVDSESSDLETTLSLAVKIVFGLGLVVGFCGFVQTLGMPKKYETRGSALGALAMALLAVTLAIVFGYLFFTSGGQDLIGYNPNKGRKLAQWRWEVIIVAVIILCFYGFAFFHLKCLYGAGRIVNAKHISKLFWLSICIWGASLLGYLALASYVIFIKLPKWPFQWGIIFEIARSEEVLINLFSIVMFFGMFLLAVVTFLKLSHVSSSLKKLKKAGAANQ